VIKEPFESELVKNRDLRGVVEEGALTGHIRLGRAAWKCEGEDEGKVTRIFRSRLQIPWDDWVISGAATLPHECIPNPGAVAPAPDGGAGSGGTTTGGTSTGGDDATGDETTGGTTGGETSDDGTTGGETTDGGDTTGGETTDDGTTGGETTGGGEPWEECLDGPVDLCEVCCELASEDGQEPHWVHARVQLP
jgi:hypothetical protein